MATLFLNSRNISNQAKHSDLTFLKENGTENKGQNIHRTKRRQNNSSQNDNLVHPRSLDSSIKTQLATARTAALEPSNSSRADPEYYNTAEAQAEYINIGFMNMSVLLKMVMNESIKEIYKTHTKRRRE